MTRKKTRVQLVNRGALAALAAGTVLALGWLFPARDALIAAPRRAPDGLRADYLRVLLATQPSSTTLRLSFADELRKLGRLDEADQALAELLDAGGEAERSARVLALQIAADRWRGTAPDSARRERDRKPLEAELQRLAAMELPPEDFARLAGLAMELGRPDLAARAHARAAALQRSRCLALPASPCPAGEAGEREASRALDDALASGDGATVASIAREVAARFSDSPELLDRAAAAALAHGHLALAREFTSRHLALRPGDPAPLRRRLELELAAQDLEAALATAQQLVAMEGPTPALLRQIARLASWAGRKEAALEASVELARTGDAEARDRALALASTLHRHAVVAELLRAKAAATPLTVRELQALVAAIESGEGAAAAAGALAGLCSARPGQRQCWEQLAWHQERHGDIDGAIRSWERVAASGDALGASCRQGHLLWRLGRRGAAVEVLLDAAATAPGTAAQYWAQLGEAAWSERRPEAARLAYETLRAAGAIDATGQERLALLARDRGDPAAAIALAEEAWQRFDQPEPLLLAIDLASESGRTEDLDRLLERAAQTHGAFDDVERYWLHRGQQAVRRGQPAAAIAFYRRALAISPASSAALPMLWLALETGDRPLLLELVGRCEAPQLDRAWWRACAAAVRKTRGAREALPFYEREARGHLDDAPWLLAWAEALDEAGERTTSWRLKARIARGFAARDPAALSEGELLAAAPLVAAFEGDARAEPFYDALRSRSTAAARESLAFWYLDRGMPTVAAEVAGPEGRAGRTNLAIALALALDDRDALERLSTNPPPQAPATARVEVERRLGHERRALRLAREAMARTPGDPALGAQIESIESGIANRLSARAGAQQWGASGVTNIEVGGAFAAGQLRLEPRAAWAGLEGTPREATARVDEAELGLGVRLPAGRGSLRLSAGASVRENSALPQAGAELRQPLGKRLDGGLLLAIDEAPDESGALRTVGIRDRLAVELGFAASARDRLGASAGLRRFRSREGEAIGSGLFASAAATRRLHFGPPALTLRLDASIARLQLRTLPQSLAQVVPAGSGVEVLLPERYAATGAGATVGLVRLGAARLGADLWAGWIWTSQRPATRLQLDVALPVARADELALAAFWATDDPLGAQRGATGILLSFAHRFDVRPSKED